MVDRSVRVRLEADISDFVSDIGVKAVAAVKRLEGAATKANVGLKKTTTDGGAGLDKLGSKADKTSAKMSKVGGDAEQPLKHLMATLDEVAKLYDELGASTDKATKSTTENSKATKIASKDLDAHANAVGRLRTAELRLSEIRNRPNQKSSTVSGAEEAVAAAERNVKRFERAGEDSGKAFGSGFKKWLTGGGGGPMAELGKSGGTVFGSGFLGALKTPILGPAIVAVLTAAVLTVLPAVGAVAAGAFVSAFGAGLAGLGILFAAKSEAVGKKWETTLGQLGSDMRLLSQPFEATLINIAGIFQRTVDKFNPVLGKAFASMAPVVEAFVARFAGSLEQLIPAIDPIVRAFNSVLDSLGPAFQSLLGDMSTSLIELAESVERNPAALADMVEGLGEILGTALQLIQVLNDVNGSFETLTGGTSLVDVVMEGLQATMAPLITLFSGLGKAIDLVNAATGRTGKDVEGAGQSMSDAANKTAELAGALEKTGAAAQHGAGPVKTLAEQVAESKKKAAEAKQAFENFISTLFGLQNLNLSLSGSQIALQAAIDAATASIKENGRTLNVNTAAGRANKSALDTVASSANAQTEALIRSGRANGVAADANVSAYDAAVLATKGFVKQAMQMGLSKKQAEAMAKSLIAIPNVTREARLIAQKKDLDTKLADARRQLKDPNLTKTRRAQLEARIAQLLAAKATAQRAIDALHGKTVDLTINTYRNMIETTIDRGLVASGKGVPKADGGFHPRGYPSYADGKLPSQAMVAAGKGAGLVQWAEQETGGEAFIPLAPSKRDRSTMILGQVANEFGLGLVKSFAAGGYRSPLTRDVVPASVDPRRYVNGTAGSSFGGSSMSREIHNHQNNYFTGVSMAEADLIAQRANAKADLMNRSY